MKHCIRFFSAVLSLAIILVPITSCSIKGGEDEHGQRWIEIRGDDSWAVDESEGHWELDGARGRYFEQDRIGTENDSYDLSQCSHTFEYNYTAETDVYGDEDFSGTYCCSCSDLPDVLYRGDTITMTISAEVVKAPQNTDRVKGMSCRAGIIIDNVKNEFFTSENGLDQDSKNVHCGRSTWHIDEYIPEMSDTLTFTMPEKDSYDYAKYFIIFFESDAGTSYWTYRFVHDGTGTES